MKAETVLGFAKLAAAVGAGVIVVKIGFDAKKKIDAGMKAGEALAKAAGEAVEKVVTKDLNPVSRENIAYRGVNHVAQAVTNDPSWNLGTKLWEALNPSKVAAEQGMTSSASISNTQKQGELLGLGPSQYRAPNWDAMAAQDAAVLANVEKAMSNSRTAFRIAELQAQKETPLPSFMH